MAIVHIVTGRAHRLLAPIVAEIGELHRRGEGCVLLVPEQFTLQAERELLERLQLKGFFTIDVLSPSRLSSRVLSTVGADDRAPLGAAGRLMAIGCALERCEDRLSFYRTSAHRRGFPEKLAALITDMKRGGLTPERLSVYADGLPEGLKREKLRDLAIIYATYEACLGERFGDGEDQLRYIAKRLPESGVLDGKYVYVYGFDTLPEQLMRLLCASAALCARLTIALVCDGESAPDGELFLPVRQGIGRFSEMLATYGHECSVEPLPQAQLPAPEAIRHIDDTLYAVKPRKLSGKQDSVFLTQYLSPYDEAAAVSREILRLCAEGMEIERIALMYPDANGYPFAVAAALRDSGLPFYTDRKLPASTHGLARFLLAALRSMANDYRNDTIVAMLRSGYAPMTFDETCALENYARSYGVNRKRWLAPFQKGADDERELCERLRRRLIEPMQKARSSLVNARDTAASLSAVMTLMDDMNVYDTLRAEEDALLREGMLVRAGQSSQIWQALLELLDQLCALSDGARVPLKYIANRLESGFNAISLAALPPAGHMLHAGTLGHYLSGDMDAVFLLGLNDGILSKSTDSLLTEDERAQTQADTEAFLGVTDVSRSIFAKLDVKNAMTLARQKLYMSYAKTAPDGAALQPLALLDKLRNELFETLPEAPIPTDALPLSARQALFELSARLRAYADGKGTTDQLPQRWKNVLQTLLRSPSTAAEAARLLRAANRRLSDEKLPKADASRLYGDRTMSVSRLERFAECPFKHFVAYGLQPQIVEDWQVDPVDKGNFYHESLQRFAELTRGRADYPGMDDAAVESLADEAVEPLVDALMEGPMGDGARSKAQYEQARRIVRRAALTITRHLAAGRFRIDRTEASFGTPDGLPPIVLRLSDGREIALRGRIDRIDRYESPEGIYLRVVDYKSSEHALDAAQTWLGLQLQLLLYLQVAVGSVPGGKPAGAFYFYVGDPLAESDGDLREAAEKALRERFQLKGVTLADVQVVHAMEDEDAHIVLPKVLKADNSPGDSAMALTEEELQALLGHAREVASELAERIFDGVTTPAPAVGCGADACAYCDYAGICGFDAEYDEPREIEKMSMDEYRERLREQPFPLTESNRP